MQKVSVSLDERDVEFLDYQTAQGRFPSRSAGVSAGVRLLRDLDLADSYAEAFAQWADAESGRLWDSTTGDGVV
jgi:Arc/MetJ-type ribon-helix-helix transcriptional regulator